MPDELASSRRMAFLKPCTNAKVAGVSAASLLTRDTKLWRMYNSPTQLLIETRSMHTTLLSTITSQ